MGDILFFAVYPAPYRAVLAQALKDKYDTDVFYANSGGDDRFSEWFQKGGYHTVDTAEGSAYFNKCKKAIKKYKLVVIMEFCGKESLQLLFLCRKHKVPYIFNCDGVMLFKHGSIFGEIVKKFLLKKATAYFASGEHAKEYFLKYGAKKEKIYFHNFTTLYKNQILEKPVSAVEKLKLREKFNLPADKKICIAVGRFIPLKRYDILLNLWKNMEKDEYLLLIGGGPEKEKYENIIKENGLQNVILEGFHKFDELMDYYKACDLFVHPTSYDVWGLIINESMANGLPVVVTDTCIAGLELVKNGENGYVTHLGDDKEFISRVQEVLRDDALRMKMSENAIKTIQPFYVENMVSTQIRNIDLILKKNER